MKRRIFVAIDISEAARSRVNRYVQQLRMKYSDLPVRWEPNEKLHLTIKFAGSIGEQQFRVLTESVDKCSRSNPAFQIVTSGTGSFRKPDRSIVLWLGIRTRGASGQDDSVIDLMSALADENEISLARMRPNFTPHLTIARLKNIDGSNNLVDSHNRSSFGPVEFEAKELVVYESKLLPTGSVYSVVSRYPFRR